MNSRHPTDQFSVDTLKAHFQKSDIACRISVSPWGGLVRHAAAPAAGCSIQDELFGSFEQLVAVGDKRGEPFDRREGRVWVLSFLFRFTSFLGVPVMCRVCLTVT